MVIFQRERAQDCFTEAKPLIEAHWAETVPPYLDLDPDWETYRFCEDLGFVRAYGLRDDGELQGYALYFVRASLHSKKTLAASQDLLYVAPAYRGPQAVRFMRWCEAQLREEGVHLIAQHVTVQRDFGSLLARMGYEKTATFWTKRLEGGVG